MDSRFFTAFSIPSQTLNQHIFLRFWNQLAKAAKPLPRHSFRLAAKGENGGFRQPLAASSLI
jgi:hypothetical protein